MHLSFRHLSILFIFAILTACQSIDSTNSSIIDSEAVQPNLWSIARRFDLKSKEIATWNRISLEELLQLGQILDLQYARENSREEPKALLTANPAVYIVRREDTMDSITRRFDIDLQMLLLWNDLRSL